MANSFRYLKRGECPICSGGRKDCRENTQTRLIHCRYDTVSTAPGFRFVGTDALGFNMWAVDDGRERNEASWSEMRQQRAAEREKRLREEASHKEQLLSVEERDYNIRKIHATLGLTTRHRQNLRSRRLTDAEIDAGKFFSIDPWCEIHGINPKLAGVDINGHKLLIGQSGIGCPIWDTQRRIIGWQTRFDDATENKYKWPTSKSKKRPNGPTAHLQNGELPISCCRPLGEVKRNSIGLIEGFLKPYIAAQLLGQITIGAAGANFALSPQQLKAYLEELSSELNTKTIDLYPDAGAVANKAVMRHYQSAIQLATEWGYSVRVAWWGQVDKTHSDIDELASFDALAYLTPEEFLALGERFNPKGHSFSGLFGWLPRLNKQLEKLRQTPWGFGRKGEVEVEPTVPLTTPAIEYQPGDRLDVWPTATKEIKNILDTSGTGSGKSFDAGLTTPELFGSARQVIYLSTEHRNPTTPTLKGWPDLEARHDGLYRDDFGKLRRVNDQRQPYVVPPNCGRNDTISALRSKNIEAADTAQLICQTCPYLEPCRGGAVFGYLNNRMESLFESRLRAHPNSLPSPDEYDYSEVVLLWEEATELVKAHRFIEVRAADWQQVFADLAGKLPAAFHALIPLLTILYQYLSGSIPQPNKYGWGDALLRAALKVPEDLDVTAITEALNADLSFLNTTAKYGVDLADLPRQQRKHFSDSDTVTAELVAQRVALNWLPDFLNVLLGNVVGGNLRIQSGVLTITLPDTRLASIAQKAAGNIFLDATATAKDLALVLGVNPESILTVRQAAPETSNLEIIQVATLGRLGVGNKRSEFCQQRVDALINQIQQDTPGKTAVIDFKRYSQTGNELRRSWWVDSRGVNDLEDASALVLVGVPCRNLGALAAEFTVLHGKSPLEGTERVKYPIQVNGTPSPELQPWFEMEVSADPEFREFCRRRILADIHQAIGRLRAHRRNSEPLRVYFIGDYPLSLPVTLQRASDITPEAATKVERVEMAIRAAVSQLQATGQKITQSALAKLVGVTQGYISRFRELLQTLLNDSNSTRNNSSAPPPDPMEVEWMGREYLPLLAQEAESELLLGVLTTFEAYGLTGWQQIWDATPAATQIKILTALMFTLNAGEWRTLCTSVGVTP